VICSDLPVLREVAGDAARYVDPHDVESIAGAIRDVLHDAEERARMSRAGRARASEFSWERTAAETRRILVETATAQR
jgi:glycosyltransferase involved in cell wall biosynthesis